MSNGQQQTVPSILLFSVCTVLAISAAGQSKPAPGACLTPQGTLCRTIRWEASGWENQGWGFFAVERAHGSTTLSYQRDGAVLERNTGGAFKNYVIPTWSVDLAEIVLPSQNETIKIDYIAKEYEVRSGTRGGATIWNPNDADCAKLATALALSGLERIGEIVIAGIRAIEYTGKGSSTRRVTVALAPSLGCLQMRNIDRDYNRLWFPTAFHRSEVVYVQIGEPTRRCFRSHGIIAPSRNANEIGRALASEQTARHRIATSGSGTSPFSTSDAGIDFIAPGGGRIPGGGLTGGRNVHQSSHRKILAS